jgi:uncharacterized damage-inducible protein DinB
MLELIRDYYRYEQWATTRVLDTAAPVPFELLTTSVLTGFEPVRSSLVHVMWAQLLWLRRWQGLPRVPAFTPEDFSDLAALRRRWSEIDDETNAFLAILTEERLAADFTYGGLKGGTFGHPLWKALLHQANHATYHRGEVAAVLTHLGYSPGELDFFRMYDGRR